MNANAKILEYMNAEFAYEREKSRTRPSMIVSHTKKP
jgi:hypothetical protein